MSSLVQIRKQESEEMDASRKEAELLARGTSGDPKPRLPRRT